jgi:rhodanese-related sulfurtransferase
MNSSTIAFIAVLVLVFVFVLRPMLFGGPRIKAMEAQEKLKSGEAVLVDVREPGEWLSGVAKPARLLPMSDLGADRRQWKPFLAENKGKLIIVYCASGMRSGSVCSTLKKEGYKVANLGGFGSWSGAGLPTRVP